MAAAAASPYFYPALISAGSSLAGAFGNSQQDRTSFADDHSMPETLPPNDPRRLLSTAVQRSDQLWNRINDPANQYQPSHIGVQGVPTFDGGGMPMPIGLIGSWNGQQGFGTTAPPSRPSLGNPGGTRFDNPGGPYAGNGPPNGPQGPNPSPDKPNMPPGSGTGGGNGGGRNGEPPSRRDPTPHVTDPNFTGGFPERQPGQPGPGMGTTPNPPPGIANPGFSLPPGIIPGVGRRSLTAGASSPTTGASDAANLIAALKLLGVKT